MFFGELVGHPQRLAVGHQQHTHGRQHHCQVGRQRHLRQGQRGQPLRQRPDYFDAVLTFHIKDHAEDDRPEQHHQAGRDLLADAGQQEEQRQRRGADSEGRPVGLGQLLDDADQLLYGVTLRLGHAEQLIELADRHKDGEAHDKAVHHRLGEELGNKAQLGQACHQKHESDDQDEGGGVGLVGGRIGCVRAGGRHQCRRHRRSEQGRRRRGSLHNQVARGAQQRVYKQGGQQGIETGLRRQAGDAGIGHGFGHDQAPQRQPGDHVHRQPGAVVMGQPRQNGYKAREPGLRSGGLSARRHGGLLLCLGCRVML